MTTAVNSSSNQEKANYNFISTIWVEKWNCVSPKKTKKYLDLPGKNYSFFSLLLPKDCFLSACACQHVGFTNTSTVSLRSLWFINERGKIGEYIFFYFISSNNIILLVFFCLIKEQNVSRSTLKKVKRIKKITELSKAEAEVTFRRQAQQEVGKNKMKVN